MDPDPDLSRTDAGLSQRITDECARLGFDDAGITPVAESEHAAFFRAWLDDGHHGGMHWLARADAVDRRTDPRSAWPDVRSAIVVTRHYPAAPADPGDADAGRAIIARYARGRDYHRVLRPRLMALLRWLEREVGRPLPAARACIDTSPVFERELARRAGLGWFGRNTMLIHPRRGSYFFIGVLFVEIELEADAPFEPDHCGTCNACVDACPTGALLGRTDTGAPLMDARRCISYLTIEHRGPIPHEFREAIGNRVFGCDICQDCYPFNVRFAAVSSEPGFAARGPGDAPIGVEPRDGAKPHPGTGSPSLIALLEMALDAAAWDSFSRGSPLRRAGRAGFARNVCVALGNWSAPVAAPALTVALSDGEPLVRGHAAWALGRIATPESRAALAERLAVESDRFVLEELRRALAS
ncbi:MAG: tRNA epoxyqueuosine(34) reductase QueG [Gemmatimonadetes bacterium]|nr:tRNA epoxyqueuosine(34) reductase QueG [Gemmatimonadota bacterium]